jgi:tetratricopeptide (TPR) repeat protein
VEFFRKLFGHSTSGGPVALVQQGTAEYLRGDFDRAVRTFTRVLEQGPPDVQALIGRGQAYLDLGREPLAHTDFLAALAQDQAAVRGHFFWRGQVLGERGEFDQEIAAYSYLLELDPECALGFAARGNAYREAGNLASALADCDAALRLGNDGTLYSTRGLVHTGRGDFRLAIADFTEAIRQNPDETSLYLNRAAAYRGLGDRVNEAADEQRARSGARG